MKERLKANIPLVILISIAILFLMNFSLLLQYLGKLLGIIHPLIIGLGIAYVWNILMVKFEKIYFPNSKNEWINKSRRGVCLILALVSIVVIFGLVSLLIIPQVIEAVKLLGKNLPIYYNYAVEWINEHTKNSQVLEEVVKNFDFKEGKEIFQNVFKVLSDWTGNIFGVVSGFFSTVFNIVIALIFAIYILTGKETLMNQGHRMLKAYMPERKIKKIIQVLKLSNEVFTNYVIGQCIEAVIIGVLCAVGMAIFRFPYATMVGSVVGITALIPMVGAYLGAGIGAFMVLTVSPIKMIFFLIFIVILQQLENNLIYPKVVGDSVGLPGIWVLVAVTIGGGLFGVTGILLSVPVAAVMYQLLNEDIEKRNQLISKKK